MSKDLWTELNRNPTSKSAAILLRVSSGSFVCLRRSSSYCKREERSTKSHDEKSQRNTRKGGQKFQISLARLYKASITVFIIVTWHQSSAQMLFNFVSVID